MKTMVSVVMLAILANSAKAEDLDCNQNKTNETMCLACNLYFETGTVGTFEDMQAVANVSYNRTQSKMFPETFCEVVWQPSQFSWTLNSDPNLIENQHVWDIATAIAEMFTMDGNDPLPDITDGALYYHADYIKNPNWVKDMIETTQIGVHKFYVPSIDLLVRRGQLAELERIW